MEVEGSFNCSAQSSNNRENNEDLQSFAKLTLNAGLEPGKQKSTGTEVAVFSLFNSMNFLIEELAPLGLQALQSSGYPSDSQRDNSMFQVYYYQ